MGVLVVELHDELSEVVGGVYGVVELFAYEGQLKAGIIVVACLEIAQQGWQGEVNRIRNRATSQKRKTNKKIRNLGNAV